MPVKRVCHNDFISFCLHLGRCVAVALLNALVYLDVEAKISIDISSMKEEGTLTVMWFCSLGRV